MDLALSNAIHGQGLRARQVLLPDNAPPRLDSTRLPIVQFKDVKFKVMQSILSSRNHPPGSQIMHQTDTAATQTPQDTNMVDSNVPPGNHHSGVPVIHGTDEPATKLLMLPMRDATFSGPSLRETHRRVGWYLATQHLGHAVGLEEFAIYHVQGGQTTGHRLLNEHQTTIVALMRGGEPMALGVSDALPLAMFVHANDPSNLKLHHLQGQKEVILVDSVINSGKTIIEFVQEIVKHNDEINITVIAGVVQQGAIDILNDMITQLAVAHREHSKDEMKMKFTLIALRLSENSFTGKGTTDTGNRLFNTTHLA